MGMDVALDGLVARLRGAARQERSEVVERVAAVYSPLAGVPWDEPEVRVFLEAVYLSVRQFAPATVVQTGTWTGASAVAIGLALRDNGAGRLYTIDPEPPEYFGVRRPVALARWAVKRAGLEEQVRLVCGYSTVPGDGGRMSLPPRPWWRLKELPCPGGYDLLVVDGDHTFRGCYLDLLHGAAGLAPGGPRAVVVHDYLGISDVRRAVQEWRRRRGDTVLRVVPSRCGTALIRC